MTARSPIRVLLIDDSALVRMLVTRGLEADPELEVVGAAGDVARAEVLIASAAPDVLVLDLELPGKDGLTFLRERMASSPVPTVVLSTHAQTAAPRAIEALAAGAFAALPKPTTGMLEGLPLQMTELAEQVKAAARAHRPRPRPPLRAVEGPARAMGETSKRLILVGASTGGVEALSQILPAFPADSPPILLVQHMPAGFTRSFAARLDSLCLVQVTEAAGGDVALPGRAYLAPGGDRHLVVREERGQLLLELEEGPPMHHLHPAVDALFQSAARLRGRAISAAVLTGMGRDGAAGLAALRAMGASTVAQDEASSIVFGMPGAAIALGGAGQVLDLAAIPAALLAFPSSPRRPAQSPITRPPP